MLTAQHGVENSQELMQRYLVARTRTDELFDLLGPGAWYERPIPERHRLIFYLGHVEAFDWNLLRERLIGLSSFDPGLDRLFAFGIDPVDGGLPTDQPADWPSLEHVRTYASKVQRKLEQGIAGLAGPGPEGEFSLELLLNVAVEHRLMHAETLAYMMHQLPLDRKAARSDVARTSSPPVQPRMVEVPAGRTILGQSRDDGAFGWDNEFGICEVEVPAFAIDQYKVTNSEYLQFMAAGGYADSAHWGTEDWRWIKESNIEHPIFWKKRRNEWYWRGMFDEVPLPGEWPVYVSHAEAQAFAKWSGKSLPTEAQWHRAAYGTVTGKENVWPWGEKQPSTEHGNFDFRNWDPTPVNSFLSGRSAFGVHDLIGNGWEWTSSIFGPLPGFQRFPFYPGYSADFFDGKHFVMKGGSARTAACMLRKSFRNWFQPHYQYVYSAFRCVTT